MDLKDASIIQKELDYINSSEFRRFFEEIVFLNCYNKSCSNDEISIYFSTSYRDGVFDVVASNNKPGKEVLLELSFSNAHQYIVDKTCKSFFEDSSSSGGLRISLFNSFLLAKYNLITDEGIDNYYDISELLDWNTELVEMKMMEERNRFASIKTKISLDKISLYIDSLNKKLEYILNRYEFKKNNLLNKKTC